MNGRRIEAMSYRAERGDYAPAVNPQGDVEELLLVLPDGTQVRLAGKGYGRKYGSPSVPDEREWTITVHEDGTASVAERIQFAARWDGWLERGVWRDA